MGLAQSRHGYKQKRNLFSLIAMSAESPNKMSYKLQVRRVSVNSERQHGNAWPAFPARCFVQRCLRKLFVHEGEERGKSKFANMCFAEPLGIDDCGVASGIPIISPVPSVLATNKVPCCAKQSFPIILLAFSSPAL